RTLRRIEKLVRELKSPRWQDAGLPAVEPQQAKRGKAYYAEYCGACHLDINRDDEQRKIQVRMSSLAAVGSDPATALSAVELMGASGAFQGGKRFYIAGDELGETAPSLYIVNHVMGGVILNNIFQTVLSRRDAKSFGHGDERHPVKYLDGEPMKRGTETSEKALLAYKARPLNGIWASPPYLHNGSVPNMYELMLPAEERSVIFQLGDWVYDEKNMGYQTTITNHASEHVFEFDTRVPGNSNAGHEWGTGKDGRPRLSHEQILAVIEYIKTL
ncbi:MAG: di-heme-cytochrome C peroxidase, partial [Pseudomonadota bacterium]